jgi:hypothetical protein
VSLLLAALAALAFFVWLGRRSGRGGEWRPAGAVLGGAAFVGAAVAGVGGDWWICIGLLLAGAGLTVSVQRSRETPSEEEARRLLGVGPEASAEDIRSAHRARLWRAHPDRGGDPRRASALNAARDRLLRRAKA